MENSEWDWKRKIKEKNNKIKGEKNYEKNYDYWCTTIRELYFR